ncbi:hypothetical protein B296_00040776 [Ensete ventricosum]|uniref:Uncharacterized protein n=1 Tax=Ensete ventricosum TaxID=4639 RepID=A0A426XNX6_ENSVE|nr:hypothetical protein B296_00040776 [Ensete ventricosum]
MEPFRDFKLWSLGPPAAHLLPRIALPLAAILMSSPAMYFYPPRTGTILTPSRSDGPDRFRETLIWCPPHRPLLEEDTTESLEGARGFAVAIVAMAEHGEVTLIEQIKEKNPRRR